MAERNMEQLSLKIPKGLVVIMDADIANTDEFRNRSEFIVAAIRFYEDHRTIVIQARKKAETTAGDDSDDVDYKTSPGIRNKMKG